MRPRKRRAGPGASLVELENAYRDRYPDYLRVATAISGSVESGSDAVHDAFVSLIRARKSYRQNGHLEAWAWAAVVNSARKQARRRDPLPLSEEALDGLPMSEGDDSRHATVRAAIARLPERQRLALFLRYYADLDYTAIAVALGTAPGTVAAALYAAHKTLRQALQEVESNA
jgi:RNA polymerase sigma-70 factor (ECF subfamily)